MNGKPASSSGSRRVGERGRGGGTGSPTRRPRGPGGRKSRARGRRLPAGRSQLMDIVLRESDRLNETIRSFLAYARPQRASTSRMDVRQVITDTATLLQNNAELIAGHRIDVDVPEGPVWYVADANQI